MGTKPPVSVAEYLSTLYRPDCDYVDGELHERNVGEQDHGNILTALILYLAGRRRELGIHFIPEQRVQVSPERFRVPGLSVVKLPRPQEQVLTTPPFLCIEILSPEDRMSRMLDRMRDCISFGVPFVWIIGPHTRSAHRATPEGLRVVTDGVLRTEDPDLAVPLDEIFSELGRA